MSRAPFQTGETLAESDCRDSVFFKGECCWSLDFVFPVSAFQHVSSSTFVSFTSSLFPVLFKQSSYIPFENLCLFSSILFVCQNGPFHPSIPTTVILTEMHIINGTHENCKNPNMGGCWKPRGLRSPYPRQGERERESKPNMVDK